MNEDAVEAEAAASATSSAPVEIIDLTQDTPERRSRVIQQARMQVGGYRPIRRSSRARDEPKKTPPSVIIETTSAPTRRRRPSASKIFECPICMEDIQAILDRGGWMEAFLCGHVLCNDCKTKTLLVKNECFKCRRSSPPSIRLYL